MFVFKIFVFFVFCSFIIFIVVFYWIEIYVIMKYGYSFLCKCIIKVVGLFMSSCSGLYIVIWLIYCNIVVVWMIIFVRFCFKVEWLGVIWMFGN